MKMRLATILCAATVGLVVSAISTSAHAFCRSTTSRAPPDFIPDPDCWKEGIPLFWSNACVGFSVQKADGKHLKAADVASVLTQAFAAWTSASCSGGAHPSIEVRQLASTTVERQGYNSGGPNVNLVIMRDDKWPYPPGGESLALTTVTYSAETGEIYDADIELNTAENKFAIADPVPADAIDLRSILTHQAGHFLGFAHSSERTSPMFRTYDTGSTEARSLKADDVAGICAVYAPDGSRAVLGGKVTAARACDPTPRGGLELEPYVASDCGMSRGGAMSGASGMAAAALTGLLLVVTRARRRGQRGVS